MEERERERLCEQMRERKRKTAIRVLFACAAYVVLNGVCE